MTESQEARKRFLDSQVEKIMAKNHARHNSEPARKNRKTGIQANGTAESAQKAQTQKKHGPQ